MHEAREEWQGKQADAQRAAAGVTMSKQEAKVFIGGAGRGLGEAAGGGLRAPSHDGTPVRLDGRLSPLAGLQPLPFALAAAGLSWETTDDKLRRYFENYGAVQVGCRRGGGPSWGPARSAPRGPACSCGPAAHGEGSVKRAAARAAPQEAFVSYDRHTGRPRGFGFVVFADSAVADKVIAQQHTIDRREVRRHRSWGLGG